MKLILIYLFYFMLDANNNMKCCVLRRISRTLRAYDSVLIVAWASTRSQKK